MDVTDPSSVERLSRELGARPVDLLINNAGILPMMPTLDEIDMDDYQRVMDVNAPGQPAQSTKEENHTESHVVTET